MNVVARTLSEFEIFAELDLAALHDMVPYVQERTYEADQLIAIAGEPCDGVYLIVQGTVSLSRLSLSGREYVIDYLGPGDMFNLVPVLDGGTHLASTTALSHTMLYLIPCPHFSEILRECPTVSRATLALLARRVRYLNDAIEDLALHTVRTRLARFLLTRGGGDGSELHRWTQEEIAAHIGTVRDVVGRTLRNFAREGMVRRENGHLVITDRAALEREAM